MVKKISEKELRRKADELVKELEGISKDPKILKEAEEFHKNISCLSPKDLLRRFTI